MLLFVCLIYIIHLRFICVIQESFKLSKENNCTIMKLFPFRLRIIEIFNKRKIEIKLFEQLCEPTIAYFLVPLHELCIVYFSFHCRPNSPVFKLQVHQTDEQQGEKHASKRIKTPFRKHSKQLSNYFNYSRQKLGQTLLLMQLPPLQIRTVTQPCCECKIPLVTFPSRSFHLIRRSLHAPFIPSV